MSREEEITERKGPQTAEGASGRQWYTQHSSPWNHSNKHKMALFVLLNALLPAKVHL